MVRTKLVDATELTGSQSPKSLAVFSELSTGVSLFLCFFLFLGAITFYKSNTCRVESENFTVESENFTVESENFTATVKFK